MMNKQDLILYHGWRSSASRRVRLCLAEKSLTYESRIIDMVKGEQHSPQYLAMNPNGVVPCLLHRGRVLYESSVIAEYLDETFPHPPIRPADPYQRALMRNFVRWVDEHCLPRLIVFNWSISMQPVAAQWNAAELEERLARVPTDARREAWTRVARKPYSDVEKAEALKGLLMLLARIEDMLADGSPWLLAEGFSLADMAAAPFVMRITEIDPAALPAFSRTAQWWSRVRERPSFNAARIEPYEDSLREEQAPQERPPVKGQAS